MNLLHIANGWYNFIQGSPLTRQMMTDRLMLCDSCPSKQQLNEVGKVIIQMLNKDGSVYICKECGCPLAAKTANPDSRCPLEKWKEWIKPETFY